MKNEFKVRVFSFFVIFSMLLSLVGLPTIHTRAAVTFTGQELLGRPEDTSMSIKVMPASACTLYYQYGTSSGSYPNSTSQVSATAATPIMVTLSPLTPNTHYYYRMQYSTDSGSTWTARSEHSFWTQRSTGSTFTFDVTSDSHINIQLGNTSNWTSTLNEVAGDTPDFLIDTGDTFAMDNGSTSVTLGDTATANSRYTDQYQYFNLVSANSAIFLTAGNHEQQEAWHLNPTSGGSCTTGCLPIMGKNAEKTYFLNPVPDSFYGGDTTTNSNLNGDHLIQDYYSWTWGDALFVVISPYWTTTTKPYTTSTGGGETDTTGTNNRWLWTLGQTQFNWLQNTVSASSAKYKFVFSHQILGGNSLTNQVGYGHGGVDSANFVEWGGYDTDGTTYTWSTNRSGWGDQPIRQMLQANHVTAFIHGHDHQYAHEALDGLAYIEIPSASFTGSFGIYTTGGNSGNTIYADSTQGPGYLRFQVTPSQTTVNFIRYNSTSVVNSFTLAPNASGPTHNLTVNVSPSGAGTTSPSGTTAIAEGNSVTVTATPNTGYAFSNWSGDCSGSTCQVTMDTDHTVQANFTAVATFNLTTAVSPSGSGTITPAAGTTAYSSGTVVTVTASANSGYAFSSWSGDCSGSGTCQVTMNTSHSVTANFSSSSVTFASSELLGSPEATQISIKVLPNTAITLRYQYGTSSGSYSNTISSVSADTSTPTTVTLTGLNPNTHYYYRMQYSTDGGSTWLARSEHSFWTQRATGSTFVFDLTSDSHVNIVMGSATTWTQVMNDVAKDNPDFQLDLGDTFAMDSVTNQTTADTNYSFQYQFFNLASANAPLFIASGNHEQTEGWHMTASTGYNLPALATNSLKKYFLNPEPDSFYTGDSSTNSYINGDGMRNDYYAWTWGDALFVVYDPYWFSTTKPYTTDPGGGEGDTTGSGNIWDWTLGQTQFNWLVNTVTASSAKYKFLFSHQLVSSDSTSGQVLYGHGGVDAAQFAEWGGYNTDGTTNTWSTNRSGWGSNPIRQTLEAAHVTAVFHGHDHQMAYEKLNNIVYQEVPAGGFTGSFGIYTTGGNSGNTIWADSTQGPGHLKVTVSPTQAQVEFFRSGGTSAVETYTMAPYQSGTTHTINASAGSNGSINPSGNVSVNDGADQAFTISANSGYHVSDVEVDSSSQGAITNYTFTGVTSDHTISATFAADTVTYSLTVNAGANGSITAPSSSPTTHNSGDVVTISASPSSGYHFVNWTGDTGTIASTTSASTTITMNGNYTITANFAQTTYTITVTQGSNGAIAPAGTLTVNSGVNQTLSITPSTGYHVASVTVDSIPVGAVTSYTFNNISANHTITASFAQTTYTLTVNAGTGGTITAPASSPSTQASGAGVTITASASSGYQFVNWTGNVSTVANVNATSTTITMNSNYTITANFAVNEVAPAANPDSYTAMKNLTMTISAPGVLSNDTDANNDTLTASKVSDPSHGTLTLNSDGSFTYVPAGGYTGSDSFTYQAYDGAQYSNTATVSITVNQSTVPGLPSSFYGEIHISDNPPTAGVDAVQAFVTGNSNPVASSTIASGTTLTYSLDVPGDRSGTSMVEGGTDGGTVTFKINGRVVGTGTWYNGTSVQLNFHPPEAIPGGPYSGDEGATINFNASANDYGNDVSTYQWDWNNDGVYETTAQNPSHAFPDKGSYPVVLKVTDAIGGEGTTTTNVTVNDVLPSNVNAGGPYTGSAGQSVALNGSATCASVDTCTYAWDLDNDGQYDDATGATASNTWNSSGGYTVGLQVTDDDGNSVTDSASVTINPASYNLSLAAGWNLVSFTIHPTSTALTDILNPIDGNYTLVYAWQNGAWLKYDTSAIGIPGVNTLSTLDETMGFWIKMTTAATLTVNGTPPGTSGTSNLALNSGWNLVGYPSTASMTVPDVFSLHGVGAEFTLIYAYHASDSDQWKKYDISVPSVVNDLLQLVPGYGYWIKVNAAQTWTVSY